MLEPSHFLNSSTQIHKPFPHQEEAVQAILKALKKHNRTHAVMACGTGKTHVCLWVAERIKAKRIVVYVPSLALINQFLHEWLANTTWSSVSCMAVCSDETVTKDTDSFVLNKEDCDFPVSTNSIEIYRFLKHKKTDIQIIFCTYHSANVLAASIKSIEPFDLAVLDEAHKTTGIYDRAFSIPLTDKNIPAKKRLFVTATPKHYNIHQKNKSGDAKLLYSMDSEAYYGPRAYTLTFRQAVNLNIISDYKVIVPVIITEEKKQKRISGEKLDERAIALQKAIKNYDISKIISFHPSIHEAGDFSYYLNQTNQLKGFKALHVNCMMTAGKRTEALDVFRTRGKTLISNARCLTEGTNVPAADMVVFFHHKRSRIDIVQAIGRVMRKHDNKDIGYIFLPLYVRTNKGEKIESAMHRCHYEQIWDVLQALTEQDEDLQQVIQSLRWQQGQKKEIDLKKLTRFIDILPDSKIDLEKQKILRRSIGIAVIENLGSNWDLRYGELQAFKDEFGHCNVPVKYKRNESLANWVGTQRIKYKRNELSDKKIKTLERIGFDWDPYANAWNERYQELIKFQQKNKHSNVPLNYTKNKQLGRWVGTQRNQYKRNKLSDKKIKTLEGIGFDWDPFENQWSQCYQELIKFKEKYGHSNVPQSYKENKQLANWVGKQRNQYKRNKLSDKKVKTLQRLGFVWDPLENQWNQCYQALIKFKEKHEHCNVPDKYKKNEQLANWVGTQRIKYKRNKLSDKKIKTLEGIGFDWDPFESKWAEHYQELINFKEKHGHCNVSKNYKNKKLWRWVMKQRRDYKKDILVDNKIKALENVGFAWYFFENQWEQCYQELISFKEKYGHCNVPQSCKENKQLANWVGKQRDKYKRNKLSDNKIKALEKLRFVWSFK